MKLNFNRQPIGIIVGLIGPLLVMLSFYLIKYSRFSIPEFVNLMFGAQIFTPLISLSVVINLLLFFLFYWTHRDYAARGVIFATMIYALLVVVLKVVS